MLSWHKKSSDSKRLSFLILAPGISIDGIRPASSKLKREGIAFFLIHFEALLLTDVVDCLIFPQPSRVRYSSNVAQVVGSAHDFDQHKIGTRKYHHPNRSRLVIPISAWCFFAALYPSYWFMLMHHVPGHNGCLAPISHLDEGQHVVGGPAPWQCIPINCLWDAWLSQRFGGYPNLAAKRTVNFGIWLK